MGKKKQPSKRTKKEKSLEVWEDYCFECKDGGLLVLCDRKDCRKAYHPKCIGKDDSFFESGRRWLCDWHRCSGGCRKSSDYRCYLCINAVCRFCISREEFGRLRGSYGFCPECLELAKMVEEGQKVLATGEEVNFDDRETYEGLFKEYWEIIMKKEGLTLDDLKYAESRMNKGKAHKGQTNNKPISDTSGSKDEPLKVTSDSECDRDSDRGSDRDSDRDTDKDSEKSELKQTSSEDEPMKETSDTENDCNSENSELKQISSEDEPMKKTSDTENDCNSEKSKLKQTPTEKRVRKRPAKYKEIGSKEFVGRGSEGERIKGTSDTENYCNSEKSELKETPTKKRVRRRPANRKKTGSNTREFVGWGSKPLIEFLGSIGKDTSQKISQDDACSIVVEYARDKNLFDPDKKKVILCDERLCTLLGRKYSSIYKIKDFLESHFMENIEQSDADDQVPSSGDEDEKVYLSASKLQKCGSGKRAQQKWSGLMEDYQKKCDVVNEDSEHSLPLRTTFSSFASNDHSLPFKGTFSSFASITLDNLKLVYLKRSLLEELSKQPEGFKDKVIGSYVKVKSNAIDYKLAYRLLPVTGVKDHPTDGTKMNHCLTVASLQDDIIFSMLSNDDIIEEECDILRQKVEDGLLERPTVVDLQKKAEILHEDIVKHWLKRELIVLQHRIDHANEKGRRDLFFDYRQRKKLLETSEEQSRLLRKMPEVVAEVIEVKKPSHSDELAQNESSAG